MDLLLEVFQNSDFETIARNAKITPSSAKDHLSFLASQGFVSTQIMDDKTIRYELSAKGYEALMAFLRLTNRKGPIFERNVNAKMQTT